MKGRLLPSWPARVKLVAMNALNSRVRFLRIRLCRLWLREKTSFRAAKGNFDRFRCRLPSNYVVKRCALVLLFVAAAVPVSRVVAADPPGKTQNVVIVTLDGFRFQEFFGGAEEGLMEPDAGGVRDRDGLRRRYLRDSIEERRETLLPFIWGTIARQGQIFGDPARQSSAVCTNGMKFSYPGYNELFCGFGDARITSNDKRDNPNLSVLEFLDGKPAFRGRVAAFCTWDVFPYIFRQGRNGLKVQAGWTPIVDEPLSDKQRATNELIAALPRYWPDNTFDVVAWQAAREHLLRHRPRVLYISLGETDEWGHGRRYDLYLDSAHQADRVIGELWRMLGDLPEYRDSTTLLLSTDHGRGATRGDWTDHGRQVMGAEHIWVAVLGPDTPPLGVRANTAVTQGQVAATIAQVLGEDFGAADSRAAPPLPDVVRTAQPR
jgi:hypothetical protein